MVDEIKKDVFFFSCCFLTCARFKISDSRSHLTAEHFI